MASIVIMELKGFAEISTQLTLKMESIGLTAERVRSAGIEIVNDAIKQAKQMTDYLSLMHIGGDTWYFKFNEFEDSISFGCSLLKIFYELLNDKGIFYIKPSLAVNIGEPRFKGERFLDDMSIETYEIADKGLPFNFYILNEAIQLSRQISWIKINKLEGHEYDESKVQIIDWQNSHNPINPNIFSPSLSLPNLLLDNEVMYSNSPSEAVLNIIHQQSHSSTIMAFGGPVPTKIPLYKDYIKSVITSLKTKNDCVWTILSYIPQDNHLNGYIWLELCRQLSIKYPDNFLFAAFTIPIEQIRPFSYHIYDDKVLHVGLRSFSPKNGTPIMSSAMMIKNKLIASRFREEFLENWRIIGPYNDTKHANILDQFPSMPIDIQKSALYTVDELLSDGAINTDEIRYDDLIKQQKPSKSKVNGVSQDSTIPYYPKLISLIINIFSSTYQKESKVGISDASSKTLDFLRTKLHDISTENREICWLDVGCGNGRCLEVLDVVRNHENICYHGIDSFYKYFDVAEASANKYALKERKFEKIDATEINFSSDKDIVSSILVLHEVNPLDLVHVLKNMLCALKKDGKLILSDFQEPYEQEKRVVVWDDEDIKYLLENILGARTSFEIKKAEQFPEEFGFYCCYAGNANIDETKFDEFMQKYDEFLEDKKEKTKKKRDEIVIEIEKRVKELLSRSEIDTKNISDEEFSKISKMEEVYGIKAHKADLLTSQIGFLDEKIQEFKKNNANC